MKNVPDIRFNGYKIWETSELGDLFNERVENKPNAEMLSVTMNDGIIKASENGRYDNSNSNKAKYKLVKVGDIAYNSMRMWQGASGVSHYEGIVSPAYTVLCPNNGINSDFFSYLFKTNRMIKKFRLHSQGLTKDTWNLKYPALSKISVAYSSDENEQSEIASYFRKLSNQIIEQQKKIASLKKLKSASLISMFPQQGETVPRVRFKGFDGEWKKKKLSECLEISKDINADNYYGKNEVLSVSDEVGVVNQIKLLGRSYAGKSVSKYKILRPNQIVYTKSPLKNKPYGIIKENCGDTGIVSVLYAVYSTKENVIPSYIHYYFEPKFRINKYLYPLVNKGAKNTMNISDETALEGYIFIPSSEDEQRQIASYFRQLDIQISEQEKRLEKLKQIKAACLDKMFV